jgi:hypothetical protein
VLPRDLHEGIEFELSKNERAEKVDARDREMGAVVLPHPETKVMAVYRPKDGNKNKVKLKCLASSGSCPACVSNKAKLDSKNRFRVKPKKKLFGTNVFVWKTDKQGNLLGKNTAAPIDFCGRPIILDKAGNWDEQSYKRNAAGDVDVVDEPTGELMFFRFNSDFFAALGELKRKIASLPGNFTEVDLIATCPDKFKNFKVELASVVHPYEYSAGTYNSAAVMTEYDQYAIKNIGAFLAKEVSHVEMVYLLGLESDLLPAEQEVEQGSLTDPGMTTTETIPAQETPALTTPKAPPPPPPPPKASVPPPPPPVKTLPAAPATAGKVAAPPPPPPPATKAGVKVVMPPPPPVKVATPPPPPPVKTAQPPPPAAVAKDPVDIMSEI